MNLNKTKDYKIFKFKIKIYNNTNNKTKLSNKINKFYQALQI